jgi:hypothetical protein
MILFAYVLLMSKMNYKSFIDKSAMLLFACSTQPSAAAHCRSFSLLG